MKLASNILRCRNAYELEKTVDILAEAGFEAIDFNSDMEEYYSDVHNKDFYTDIKKYAQNKGIVFSQAHAPYPSSYDDEEKSKKRFNEIVTGMKNASYTGAEMIVIHPCKHLIYSEEANREKLFEYNMDFYKKLIPYSEEYDIKIAIENINEFTQKPTVGSTAESLSKLYDELNNDAFVVCFDIGHVNLLGSDSAEAIMKLGKRIKCLHVHDNSGIKDEHTLPYYGNINWENVMKALADSGYSGNLSYEAGGFLSSVPENLYPNAMKYMAEAGHYLIERFHYYKALCKRQTH